MIFLRQSMRWLETGRWVQYFPIMLDSLWPSTDPTVRAPSRQDGAGPGSARPNCNGPVQYTHQIVNSWRGQSIPVVLECKWHIHTGGARDLWYLPRARPGYRASLRGRGSESAKELPLRRVKALTVSCRLPERIQPSQPGCSEYVLFSGSSPRSATSPAVRIPGTSCLLSSSIFDLDIAQAEGQTR